MSMTSDSKDADVFGILDAMKRLNDKLPPDQIPTASSISDVAAFYSNLEPPESEPVAGWELTIPDDGNICFISRPSNPAFKMSSYKLTPEAQRWCDENMRDRYWVLGASLELGTGKYGTKPGLHFYFTSERDYILFKMRWG